MGVGVLVHLLFSSPPEALQRSDLFSTLKRLSEATAQILIPANSRRFKSLNTFSAPDPELATPSIWGAAHRAKICAVALLFTPRFPPWASPTRPKSFFTLFQCPTHLKAIEVPKNRASTQKQGGTPPTKPGIDPKTGGYPPYKTGRRPFPEPSESQKNRASTHFGAIKIPKEPDIDPKTGRVPPRTHC